MSEFADYVEQQQNLRFPIPKQAAGLGATKDEHHEELDDLLDNLDLAEAAPRLSLRTLVLGQDDDTLQKLRSVIAERIEEGAGEAIFDLGFENSGDSMRLTLDEWNAAYERTAKAAKLNGADCDLLLTKNIGGTLEAESTRDKPEKGGGCHGKILIRRTPANVEDVIETRIAVVGNGEFRTDLRAPRLLDGDSPHICVQWTLGRAQCWACW